MLDAPPWLTTDFAPGPGSRLPAQPFFCEENALRQALALSAARSTRTEIAVLFVLNPAGAVLFFEQRVAAAGAPMVWDYHVVTLAAGRVLDPDCRAGSDLALGDWLAASFPYLGDPDPTLDAWRPGFRPVALADALERFSSDRRHMRGPDGTWLQPPPPWSAPSPTLAGDLHTLPRFLKADDAWGGPLLAVAELLAHPAAQVSAGPPRAP